MTTIFHIEGGVGKNVAATAVIRSYKKQNSENKIIVNTAWGDVFQNNPNVDRIYPLGNTPYFYEDFIYNKPVNIFAHDPYKTTSHITKKLPLIKSWCEMIDVEYDNNSPELHFNFRELEFAQKLLPATDKPILIFQPFGGPQNQELPYSWMRDIHPSVAQQIVNHFSNDYTVLHICYPHHPNLQNTIRYDQIQNKKILFALLSFSKKRILIDSSLQHAASAMGLISTVVWVATQPEVFGYGIHKNIKPNIEFPKGTINSYLFDYNFTGSIAECPYKNIQDIFDIQKIIE
jgi:hypothetical protein